MCPDTTRDRGTSLFDAGPLRAVELDASDVPALQRFFEANPEYFFDVSGQAPAQDEALQELQAVPPADMAYGRQWLLGFVDDAGELVAMASVASDFLAADVWLIGLFVVASSLHGTGTAHIVYRAFESWARDDGGRWIRLAVVMGNAKAERFWRKVGYTEVRQRGGVAMGQRINTLRIMVKPLAAGDVSEYLALVPRDRPEKP
jgi:GNAT superfamily N-acetyltransferase